MSERQFFVLSVRALRRSGLEFELGHATCLLVCAGADEAQHTGIIEALKQYPLAERLDRS